MSHRWMKGVVRGSITPELSCACLAARCAYSSLNDSELRSGSPLLRCAFSTGDIPRQHFGISLSKLRVVRDRSENFSIFVSGIPAGGITCDRGDAAGGRAVRGAIGRE